MQETLFSVSQLKALTSADGLYSNVGKIKNKKSSPLPHLLNGAGHKLPAKLEPETSGHGKHSV